MRLFRVYYHRGSKGIRAGMRSHASFIYLECCVVEAFFLTSNYYSFSRAIFAVRTAARRDEDSGSSAGPTRNPLEAGIVAAPDPLPNSKRCSIREAGSSQ